jgi:hypothetical protein
LATRPEKNSSPTVAAPTPKRSKSGEAGGFQAEGGQHRLEAAAVADVAELRAVHVEGDLAAFGGLGVTDLGRGIEEAADRRAGGSR